MNEYGKSLLIGICEKLQLPPSKYELANDRYQTITKIIQDADVFKKIDLKMYPHGSFRLKTTVKPLSENEYDLDFVVEIPHDLSMNPQELYKQIFEILSKDGIHNDMVIPKKRCIRIDYAGDFHMDIMPGQLYNAETNEIIVPDRELRGWYHHSNPIGFAEWFEDQAKQQIKVLLEKQYSENTEPIADQQIASKLEPLRRAVQLVKRYRDIYCKENDLEPVRSIIICTLMGQISSAYSDEIEIIKDFCDYVNSLIREYPDKPFVVRNPVVDEVLSEKWNENSQFYMDFVKMIQDLSKDIVELSSFKTAVDIGMKVKKMFGENITSEVIKEQAEKISKARENRNLAINESGTLTMLNEGDAVTIVKPNTFYGS